MIKNCVATLNIGSKDITLTVGERSVNGAFSLRAVESVEYYSYFDGEFEDVKELERKISNLFSSVVSTSAISKILTVYVGVPGEFSKTLSKNYKITFAKPKKITVNDVKYLYENGYVDDDPEYKLINRSAVYFVLDNYKTHTPIGKTASSISARIFYGLAINHFIEIFDGILGRLGVNEIKYVNQNYADATYLFPLAERDLCKLLINVGYSTTSLSIICGNGLLYSSSFAYGGGMVVGYLADALGCEFSVAELIKNKLNLGLKDKDGASYVVSSNEYGDFAFSRNECNKVAKTVLDSISEMCDKAVSGCTLKVPSDIDIAFTGEGICDIKGAVEYISTRLGVFPKTVAPKVPHYNKPNYTERFALLSTALNLVSDKLFFT